MKGYIVSFSAILLLSSMLLFSAFYSENVQNRNYSSEEIKKYSKAEFIKDDLGFDLNKLIGTGIEINRTGNLEIVFREEIPADFNKMDRIQKFKEFAESSYSEINNIKVKIIASRINNSVPIKFSNGLVYEYGFGAESSAEFFSENGNSNMSLIDLNLNINASSVEVTETLFSLNPDLTVNLNYIDLNSLNEKHQILLIDSSQNNVITARFSDNLNDVIEIHLGSFEGKNNALKVWNRTSGQNKISLEFRAVMPELDLNSGLKVFADIDLNYLQTDLNSYSLIELKGVS